MKKLIDYFMGKARKFTLLDYSMFKVALFSAGLLVGLYFKSFFGNYLSAIWVIFLVSYVFLMYSVFTKK